MLAKIVAWGETREEARLKLAEALRRTVLLGVPTNRAYLAQAVAHPVFVVGEATTGFVAGTLPPASEATPDPRALALAATLLYESGLPYEGPAEWFNWSSTGVRAKPMRLEVRGRRFDAMVEPTARHAYRVAIGDTTAAIALQGAVDGRLAVEIDGVRATIAAVVGNGIAEIALPEFDLVARDATGDPAASAGGGSDGVVRSPMNGRVVAVNVAPGQTVARGVVVAAVEAMKMEHAIEAPVAGKVVEVPVAAGAQVTPGTVLVRIEPGQG
jgi:geranyl-CoA carboxylase alpha subunit